VACKQRVGAPRRVLGSAIVTRTCARPQDRLLPNWNGEGIHKQGKSRQGGGMGGVKGVCNWEGQACNVSKAESRMWEGIGKAKERNTRKCVSE